jgi:hypothetical protein
MEEGLHTRFSLEGELTWGIAPGVEVRLTRVEVRFRGSFAAPEAPFRMKLEGPLDEIRKLGVGNASIAALLPHASEPPAGGAATVALLARADHIGALGRAAAGLEAADAEKLLHHEAWMTLLFTLGGYEAESIGTVVRTVE